MRRIYFFVFWIACFTWLGAAEPADFHSHTFGAGAPIARLEAIPPDHRLRSRFERLTPSARERALRMLASCPRADLDCLHVDASGRLFYHCPARIKASTLPQPAASVASLLVAQTTLSVPIAQPPHTSRSASAKKLFLDFRGGVIAGSVSGSGNNMVITGSVWNVIGTPDEPTSWYPSSPSWTCIPYRVDSTQSATTFSITEQANIQAIWQRVSELYSGFDVDVTTIPPATYPAANVAWIMITTDVDADGKHLPHFGYGGISFVNVFGDPTANPAYPSWVDGGMSADAIADAIAHEAGHAFGLHHDGYNNGSYYYPLSSSPPTFTASASVPMWGPIMGAPYGCTLTQWSKGEYSHYYFNDGEGGTTDDDIAILTGKLSAVPLFGVTVLSGPSFSAPADKCLIRQSSDTNQFTVTCAGWNALSGTLTPTRITASGFTSGISSGSLFASLSVQDANNSVTTALPTASGNAAISNLLVPSGTCTLIVSSVGAGDPQSTPPSGFTSYGSVGTYTLSGTLAAVGHLTVTGSGNTTISSGDVTPTIADGTDFGRVYTGTTSATNSFTMGNDGSLPLTIGSIALSGSGAGQFTITAKPASGTVINPAGAVQTISISYQAPANGTQQQATVNIPYTTNSLSFTSTFMIQGSVGRLPVITGPSTVAGVIGTSLSAVLTTSDLATSFQATNLPPGITLDNAGIFSGVPTTVGTWSTQIVAANEFSAAHGPAPTATVTFTMTAPVVILPPGGGGGGGLCGLGSGVAGLLIGLSLILRNRTR